MTAAAGWIPQKQTLRVRLECTMFIREGGLLGSTLVEGRQDWAEGEDELHCSPKIVSGSPVENSGTGWPPRDALRRGKVVML